MKGVAKFLMENMPDRVRNELMLQYFGRLKIPLVGFVGPRIVELSSAKTILKVPLRRHTMNHLNSMYFGAVCTAADVTGALIAMNYIVGCGHKVHLSFKDFHADFIRRAEGDTYFTCVQGSEIIEFIDRSIQRPGQRMNMPVHVTATVPDKSGEEPVAKFTLTLSVNTKA